MQPTSRRQFLQGSLAASAGLAAGLAGCRTPAAHSASPRVMTVLGPIPADAMGLTLPHEHVLVDFVGADQIRPGRYSFQEAYDIALPFVQQARDLGCSTLAECTPAYLGRDVQLLKRLAETTGIHLLTNTGYYGAARNKFLPLHAIEENSEQLARRWLREWESGIQGSGVRPGFIKIGVDAGKLTELHRKLVRAAARTHQQSGLTIVSHTGDGIAALDQIQTLFDEGIAADAFIWVHAQNETDLSLHVVAAERGAWIEFDGLSPRTIDQHVQLVSALKHARYLDRVLVSHDAGWYHVGEPNGGEFRPYDTLFTGLVPALQSAGFTELDLRQLLVLNPRNAFALRRRLA